MRAESSPSLPVDPVGDRVSSRIRRSDDREANGRRARRASLSLVAVVALIGIALDQCSKAWAFAASPNQGGPRTVAPGLVAGVLATNEGAVAHLAGHHPMTATICGLNGLMLLAVGLCWSYRRGVPWSGRDALFIGLLTAGMVGNSIDRLALGHVRDFLVAEFWPLLIFNLADVFIMLGFLLLLGSCAITSLGAPRAALARVCSSS
jgi:lipoprotein signal peptidase